MAADPINLVLVYSANAVDVEDFKKVAARAQTTADNIKVHIQVDKVPDKALVDELAQHPTFVFSPMQLIEFFVTRGRVYAGRPMRKSEQLLRLELAGVYVPKWTSMDRGKRFDPAIWGDHVVIKPEINSGARGVTIMSTAELNRKTHRAVSFKRHGNNFVVQKLVRSRKFSKIRVQVLFDEVLHARQFRFKEEMQFDTMAQLKAYERQFTTTTNIAEFSYQDTVFEQAKMVYKAFDDVPMLGLDVMLDEEDNPVFIEANPGGNTWHYSSAHTGRSLRKQGVYLEEQFGAFERAGELLAKRALAEAI